MSTTYTPDFDGSPYRVAFDRAEGEYVIVEVATGAHLGYYAGTPAGYQDAYRHAAGHNADAAALALEERAAEADGELALAEEREDVRWGSKGRG